MSVSLRKLEANRRNAARSTGPRTPEGKTRVSQNAVTHGCTAAKAVLLHNESHDRFVELLNAYREHFKPTNPIAANLVEDLATARWRLYRIWALEAATLDLACDTSAAELRQSIDNPDHPTRLAFAFQKLAAQSPLTPELLHRYESRYHRQFYRALLQLNAPAGPPDLPKSKTEPQSRPVPQPEPPPQSRPQPELQPVPAPEPPPQSRPQPELQPEPTPEPPPQPQPQPQPEPTPEPPTQSQPEPEPEPENTALSMALAKLRLLAAILVLCFTLLLPKAAAQPTAPSAKQTHRAPQPAISQPVATPPPSPHAAATPPAAAPAR